MLISIIAAMAVLGTKPVDLPVTDAEALAAFSKVEAAMSRSLSIGLPPALKIQSDAKPVTREEVLSSLSLLRKFYQPYFKLKVRPQYFDASALNLPAGLKPEAERLIKEGFVQPVGHLVFGPDDHFTTDQLGGVIGFFVSRWAYSVHMPSPKWTPFLEPQTPRPAATSAHPALPPSSSSKGRAAK